MNTNGTPLKILLIFSLIILTIPGCKNTNSEKKIAVNDSRNESKDSIKAYQLIDKDSLVKIKYYKPNPADKNEGKTMDTIISFTSVNEFTDFDFDYPEWDKITGNNENNTITFQNGKAKKLVIKYKPFEADKHSIEYADKQEKIISLIDKQKAYGTEFLPETEISEIIINGNENTRKLTGSEIQNLFNFNSAKVYDAGSGRIIIWLRLGENATSTDMILLVTPDKVYRVNYDIF